MDTPPVQYWSKNGGIPQALPFMDTTPDGSVYTDLENNPEGRALCGWVEAGAPQRVSKMQMRLALARAGLFEAVEAYIYETAHENHELKIYYEDASEFWRTHPMTLLVQQVLNKTDEEVDALFIAAKQII